MSIKPFNISVTYPKAKQEKQAETRLTQWFDRYLFSECAAVRSIAKALITRRDAVLSCIVFSYSNGPMEGINNKIKIDQKARIWVSKYPAFYFACPSRDLYHILK
ncbi:hypothetical protein LR69_04468 [Geobacillus sp. BCO2]|nr:hypothetical protein LR69_04468 [Geobacillus sp. BCO2]